MSRREKHEMILKFLRPGGQHKNVYFWEPFGNVEQKSDMIRFKV
jgi:hypothetical protein